MKAALGLRDTISDDDFLLIGFLIAVAVYVVYYKYKSSKPAESKDSFVKKNDVVQVRIQWCGGCGFQDKYEEARTIIQSQYGELNEGKRVEVISVRDPGITGNFEIKVDGELVHSMKTKRHGFMHKNPERISAVFSAIDSALKRA